MEFLRKILNFERTSETLNPNFRDDAFPPCTFITSRGGRHLKERSKNTLVRTSKTALEKSNRGLFVFKTTVLYISE
jgi:hypothetical protein